MSLSFTERLWSGIAIAAIPDCWLWTRKRDHGYGRIKKNGKMALAHVAVWELHNRTTKPEGKVVMHACDEPGCCNPYHLKLGTHKDNTQDALAKGRLRLRAGIGTSKLTEGQVREIKDRLAEGEQLRPLGREFGVSKTLISFIRDGKLWKGDA